MLELQCKPQFDSSNWRVRGPEGGPRTHGLNGPAMETRRVFSCQLHPQGHVATQDVECWYAMGQVTAMLISQTSPWVSSQTSTEAVGRIEDTGQTGRKPESAYFAETKDSVKSV